MHGILDVNVDVTLGNANVVWFKVHAILYRMYVVPEACKFPLQASNYDNYVRTEWRSEDGWIGWIPSEVRHACSLATAHSLQGLCVLGQKCFWWLVVSCSSIQFGQEYRQSQLMLAVSVASGNIFSISYKILEHHSGAIDVTWPRDQEQHSLWQTNLVGKCCQLLACAANMFKFLHPFKILFQPIESTCSLHVMKRFFFLTQFENACPVKESGRHCRERDAPEFTLYLDAVGSILGRPTEQSPNSGGRVALPFWSLWRGQGKPSFSSSTNGTQRSLITIPAWLLCCRVLL